MSIHAAPPPAIVSEPYGISYATANQLGKGGFAICFKAERLEKDRPTGHLVALKIVKTKMEPAKLAQKFVTELQIHSKLNHPNIVAFHRAFSFGESTYVVLELCSNGSLADLLKRRKNITMPEIRRFIIQVSGAVKYLHARNIVHRDLKTGNLFLDEHMNIKVGDFGLAALLVSGKDMDAKRRTTMCGTPNYLAPEILEKGKGHNEKVDLWAIGVIAYTLAVGRAPFHAASKDEIYKKLKSGDYSWPELSSITNEISADLRDLVSSLLVAEELRPNPDQIVSHAFFKIAFVPKHMSRNQLTKIPTWPNAALPSPEVLQRGYSDSWWHVCKESGVGEYLPGKFFQLNSGKRIRSVVRDIEREVAAGRQPVLPIPSDTVYTTYPYSGTFGFQANTGLEEISEERESTANVRQLREISNNEVQAPPTTAAMETNTATRKRKDIDLMPPPPYARRQGTVRSSSLRPKLAEEDTFRPYSSQPVPQVVSESVHKQSMSASQPESADDAFTYRRSVDASLARRPRALRKNLPARESAQEGTPMVSTDLPPPNTAVPARTVRTRTRVTAPEVIDIYDEGSKPDRQPMSSIPSVAKSVLPVANKRSRSAASAFPGTDPEDVLARLCLFRHNVASAIQRKRIAPPRRAQPQLAKPLPFVSRWVDYSRKHGVGYVLEDGTVGFIANAVPLRGTPVTHVAVRNGEQWLKCIGKRFENLDKVPFQILQDAGLAGIRIMNPSTCDERERERIRMLKVLWVKFGRYMVPGVGESQEPIMNDVEKEDAQSLLFVRFYQRLGNVGVWAFSDGCIQMHFPDHTKFVFSADGQHVSATLVSIEGVSSIEQSNDLPMKLLRDRETLLQPIHNMLYGSQYGRGQKLFAEIVRANMVEQKIDFLQNVLEQWIEGGGLGRGDRIQELQWQGLWVSDHAKKIDWVTVGRHGGDDVKR